MLEEERVVVLVAQLVRVDEDQVELRRLRVSWNNNALTRRIFLFVLKSRVTQHGAQEVLLGESCDGF